MHRDEDPTLNVTAGTSGLLSPGQFSLYHATPSIIASQQATKWQEGKEHGQTERRKRGSKSEMLGHESWAGPTGHLVQQPSFTGLFYNILLIVFLSSGWRGSVACPRSRSRIPTLPTTIITVITTLTTFRAASLCWSLPPAKLHLIASSQLLYGGHSHYLHFTGREISQSR